MKKDKEWLKKDIKKVSNDYPTYHDKRDDLIKKMVDTHEVLKLIDRLDEPEITEEQALNKLAESYPFSADGINAILQAQLAGYSPVSTMKFIQSNEPELPVVPLFVADYLSNVDVYSFEERIEILVNSHSGDSYYFHEMLPKDGHISYELGDQLYEYAQNEKLVNLFRLINGHTIEPEKKYILKNQRGFVSSMIVQQPQTKLKSCIKINYTENEEEARKFNKYDKDFFTEVGHLEVEEVVDK